MRRRIRALLLAALFAVAILPATRAAAADYSVSGTIVDGNSAPVQGTVVELWNLADTTLFASSVSATDGAFSLGPVPEGDYYVELHELESDSWYAYTSVTLAGTDLTGLVIRDTFAGGGPGYMISGTVVDAVGDPTGGIFVQLWSGDDVDLIDQDKSDAAGGFSVGPVPDGDYILELWDPVMHEWYDYHYGSVAGADVTGVEMHADVSPITRVSVVSEATSRPVSYASVLLERAGEEPVGDSCDISGVFVTQSSYDTITVSAPGYESRVVTDVLSGTEVQVALPLSDTHGVVRGVVWDSSDVATITRDWGEGIDVGAYAEDSADDAWYYDNWSTTDPDGAFEIVTTSPQVVLDFWDDAVIVGPHENYAYEYWKDVDFISEATGVDVALGVVSRLPEPVMLDHDFSIAGAISGTASWTPSPDLMGQYVEAWKFNASDAEWQPYLWWDAPGDAYLLENLSAGDYKLAGHILLVGPGGEPKYSGGAPVFSDAWYRAGSAVPFYGSADMQDKISSAETVSVGATSTVTGIDFVLSAPNSKVTRIDGYDRYGVAANVARAGWDSAGTRRWEGVEHVIVVNGEPGREADALSASGLAGAYDAPILLTQSVRLPAVTRSILAEIARRNPGLRIHIVGGVASVPDARWNEIRAVSGVSSVKDRIAGADRYEVSVRVAKRIVSLVGGAGNVGGVLIIAGDDPAAFYDALAASPLACSRLMPMLAVRRTAIPPAVSGVLGGTLKGVPRDVVNSSAYVSDWVKGKAGARSRLATSADRYTAAAQIARAGIASGWAVPGDTAIAAKLPDALTGGAFIGKHRGVILFTDSSLALRPAAAGFIGTNSDAIGSGWVLGGPRSVPVAQENAFKALVQ